MKVVASYFVFNHLVAPAIEDHGDSIDTEGSSGYHPNKIPRRQRGDTGRSSSPQSEPVVTPHQLATQPPVMRGRKKSVERDSVASPPSSLRYLHNSSVPTRSTTRIPRAQRSLSPQPSTTRSESSPPPLDSLGTHSAIPSTRSHLSPSRGSSKSPPRSPTTPISKGAKGRGSTNISPPRTTSRTIPRTPTSSYKSGGGTKAQKDRTPVSVRPMMEEVKSEEPKETKSNRVDEKDMALEQSEKYIMSLVVVCSHIKYFLAQYRCNECIAVCQLLPRRHFSSGWVQQIIGRAYFELNDYKVILLLPL